MPQWDCDQELPHSVYHISSYSVLSKYRNNRTTAGPGLALIMCALAPTACNLQRHLLLQVEAKVS